jgi:hypothetical protein
VGSGGMWPDVLGRSKMNMALFYLFKIFPTNSNFKWFKEYLPVVETFQIKYGFVRNQIRNNFPYWNFSKFGVEFELKFENVVGFEIQ